MFSYNSIGRFPPNDVSRMQASAKSFHQLSRQAEILMNKIQADTHFATQLRGAAQVDNKEKVNQLIGSTVESKFEVSYTPGGLNIKLRPANIQECSTLEAFVCW